MVSIKTKEMAFSVGALVIAALTAWRAYLDTDPFRRDLLVGTSTTFLGVAIALAIVNVYLHEKSKQEAGNSLLKLIGPPIADYHNTFRREGQNLFGKTQFDQMIDRYVEANGNPNVFGPDERNKIYD